jgi:SHS2 domain-containing protein
VSPFGSCASQVGTAGAVEEVSDGGGELVVRLRADQTRRVLTVARIAVPACSPRTAPGGRARCGARRAIVYRWTEHTGEFELQIEAETEEAVYADALTAFAELLEAPGDGEPASFDVTVSAPRPDALADWLGELVFLAETKGFVPDDAQIALSDTTLQATVHGRLGEPSPLVKAVTYHRLAFGEADGRWRARVVLDV